ncbi:MAG: CopG family transcriptional regulator [Acidobacteria bacterium]|nr:CopG family transcriptional regulator [Acidobacteriota bacterium]
MELTESQLGILHLLSLKTGKTESELVKEAVNRFIDEFELREISESERRDAIEAAAGIWKDRDDLSDEFFEALRRESSRSGNWSETESNGE